MMRNLVVAKARAGMSTRLRMRGNQDLMAPPRPASCLAAGLPPSPSAGAASGFLSGITNQSRNRDPGLSLQVHQFLQHFVAGGDDAGVGLVGSLGRDQVGELAG